MTEFYPKNLQELECALEYEQQLMNYPLADWVIPLRNDQDCFDVIILGGGMAGMSAALCLLEQGVRRIKILDASQEGQEGPWMTYAKMNTLRSGKQLTGPASYPFLTFQAWFTARFGKTAWKDLYKIPTPQWMDYLKWFRKITNLPIENTHLIKEIEWQNNKFVLRSLLNGVPSEVYSRKVILATGRAGSGSFEIPSFAKEIPKNYCAHTSQLKDYGIFKNKKMAILGIGASAFDAAAALFEAGCTQVDLLTRRTFIPDINKAASCVYPGFTLGYYFLPDHAKRQFFSDLFDLGGPPPFESLDRVRNLPVIVKFDTVIHSIHIENERILINTSQGCLSYDFLILATGFQVNLNKRKELQSLAPLIKLWKDQPSNQKLISYAEQNQFPYLGPHFEFQEKEHETAPFLKHLYCFNYGSLMSHGLLSSDIPQIGYGAKRIAEGIAIDFFTEQWEDYNHDLKNYNIKEFNSEKYSFLNN